MPSFVVFPRVAPSIHYVITGIRRKAHHSSAKSTSFDDSFDDGRNDRSC
jgi:hypothetical protein